MPNFKFLVLFVLFISCKNIDNKDVESLDLNSKLKDGELILTVNDNSQSLKVEGNIMDYYTSEDKKDIAVEIEKVSTLSILNLYKWDDSSEEYLPNKTNINKLAWEEFEQNHSIKTDELESSHVYFLKWKGKDSIMVELRGNTGMGTYISDTLVLKY